MRWQNFTHRELHKLVPKLGLVKAPSRGPHPRFSYILDGKPQFKITLPNIHGGSGSMSTGFLQDIKRRLKVTNRQFEGLVNCPLSAEEYAVIIRESIGR